MRYKLINEVSCTQVWIWNIWRINCLEYDRCPDFLLKKLESWISSSLIKTLPNIYSSEVLIHLQMKQGIKKIYKKTQTWFYTYFLILIGLVFCEMGILVLNTSYIVALIQNIWKCTMTKHRFNVYFIMGRIKGLHLRLHEIYAKQGCHRLLSSLAQGIKKLLEI